MDKKEYLETLENARLELKALTEWVEANYTEGESMERPEGATEIVEAIWDCHSDQGVPDDADFPNG